MSEDLEFLFALVLSGASIGLMYSLIALGFVLVYKATDAINFAQGEFVMLAGMVVVTVLGAQAPLIAAIVVVLLGMVGLGVAPLVVGARAAPLPRAHRRGAHHHRSGGLAADPGAGCRGGAALLPG